MFTYFNKNRARYEKGQLSALFILILVILIIMAIVTLNLSKVSFIKTYSSNAADAGALGAASAMAGVFNSMAKMNNTMETDYWEFFYMISGSFAIALFNWGIAIGYACPEPCFALQYSVKYVLSILGIMGAISWFYYAQYYFYKTLRENAYEGRDNAVEAGHGLAFANSGINLKKDSPPADVQGQERRNNYRDTFIDFLDDTVGSGPEYIYTWRDGQDRLHSVQTVVGIDSVGEHEVKVALSPFANEMAMLATSYLLGVFASMHLSGACACSRARPVSESCVSSNCSAASWLLIFALTLTTQSWAGLAPAYTIHADSSADVRPYIICWLEDIKHNRLVRVETRQHHEGADLGLWQTRYPDTFSYAVATFQGNGKIHPPKFRHDADIIETDRIAAKEGQNEAE